MLERYVSLVSSKIYLVFLSFFLEGAELDLLHGGQAVRTLQKSVIEKFIIIFWL